MVQQRWRIVSFRMKQKSRLFRKSTGEETGTFANAFALYLVGWTALTMMLLIASLRSSVGLVVSLAAQIFENFLYIQAVFFFLTITFILLFSAEMTGKAAVGTAAGVSSFKPF